MLILGVFGRQVGMRRVLNQGDAIDAGRSAPFVPIAMVEERQVPHPHPVAHVVPGLIIAYARPRRAPIVREIVDGVAGRFGFDEPVVGGHE